MSFIKELGALLKKHSVTITARDEYIGHSECGEDIRISFEFDDYKKDDITLGGYVCSETLENLKGY